MRGYRSLIFLVIFLLSAAGSLCAKAYGRIRPDSSNSLPFIVFSADEGLLPKAKSTSDSSGLFLKYQQFAIGYDTLILSSEYGAWQKVYPSGFLWQLGIAAPNASSINLIFDPFYLPPGTWLDVIPMHEPEMKRRYTFRNNSPDSVLPIIPFRADSIILSLHVSDSHNIDNYFRIRKVSVEPGRPANLKTTDDRWFGQSAYCHRDVNCYTDKAYQHLKHAVVRYIFDGTIRCTGTLVNNTRQDEKPYILTAGHCIQNQGDASSAIFYFDYESPYCDGPDGTIQALTGSQLVSRSSRVDFALVELNQSVPYSYHPIFAGWDRGDVAPDSIFAMHHPMGDVKKITVDYDSPDKGTYGGQFDAYTHWVIPSYTDGTTEIGSSGCALFDPTGRVIGTLSGGGKECSVNIYDRYQRFHFSWGSYPAAEEQLANWLDPSNKNVQFINAFDPGENYRNSLEELKNYSYTSTFISGSMVNEQGYLAGHNSMQKNLYAEHFFVNGTKYLDGVYFRPSRVFYTNDSAFVLLKIWNTAFPNDDPVHVEQIYLFELSELEGTYFILSDFVKVDYGFYVGFEIFYQQPQDTFALAVRTPTSAQKNTAFTRFNNVWQPLTFGSTELNTGLELAVRVFDYYPDIQDTSKFGKFTAISIYPNPAHETIQLLIKSFVEGKVSVLVYNMQGAVVLDKTLINPEKNIPLNIALLPEGVYIIQVAANENTFTQKFIKL